MPGDSLAGCSPGQSWPSVLSLLLAVHPSKSGGEREEEGDEGEGEGEGRGRGRGGGRTEVSIGSGSTHVCGVAVENGPSEREHFFHAVQQLSVAIPWTSLEEGGEGGREGGRERGREGGGRESFKLGSIVHLITTMHTYTRAG